MGGEGLVHLAFQGGGAQILVTIHEYIYVGMTAVARESKSYAATKTKTGRLGHSIKFNGIMTLCKEIHFCIAVVASESIS